MAYSSCMRRFRILVQNRAEQTNGRYGIDTTGIEWNDTVCLWASVEWAKGKSAMREGSLDAYAAILVRVNWSPELTMRSRIVWQGQTYQILTDTFHADKQANTIQFHAQLLINDK